MKRISFKKLAILLLLSISGVSLIGCTKTYRSTPKHMRGYYLSSYQKSNESMPLLIHFTKHHVSSAYIPYNRKKIAYRAIRNQELQLYEQGLKEAETNPNGSKQIIQDRNMLKKLNNNFNEHHSNHYQALNLNLRSTKKMRLSNVKYIHHCYYFKGYISSPHYFIIHHKLKKKSYNAHKYSVNKFKYNGHHLQLIVAQPIKAKRTTLHPISHHIAKQYLSNGQIQ